MSDANSKSEKSLEDRISSLEASMSRLLIAGGVLALFGLSAGGLLWSGYASLRDKEISVRNDFSQLEKDYAAAQENIASIKAENVRIFTEALDKYDKMSQSYLELRTKVLCANEAAEDALRKAGDLTKAVGLAKESADQSAAIANKNATILSDVRTQAQQIGTACTLVRDMQSAMEAYLADKLKQLDGQRAVKMATFEVSVTGFQSTCTFVNGKSIPYPRTIGGSYSNSTVVVPENSVCLVKTIGSYSEVRIHESIRDRVIVETKGFQNRVSYFK